jgi:formylglycine-generating enzyme required for sulfatase activity
MSKYEVTQAQWQAVMGNNPSEFKNCGGNCPVESVSWEDAQKFIQKLNARDDGYVYRLPTEAEWEYACRAGSTGDYAGDLNAMAWYGRGSITGFFKKVFGGTGSPSKQANKGDESRGTHPVGRKRPNAWGLYDMHGNVWEWCQDWYSENYYAESLSMDSGGPITGSLRVKRGGGWNLVAERCRSAYRDRNTPVDRSYDLGFRLVRTRR